MLLMMPVMTFLDAIAEASQDLILIPLLKLVMTCLDDATAEASQDLVLRPQLKLLLKLVMTKS
jgi:hypothetical protein